MTAPKEMLPCPNPSCDGVRPFLVSTESTRKERPHWHIHCANCKMDGPQTYDPDEAGAFWNALPRRPTNEKSTKEGTSK